MYMYMPIGSATSTHTRPCSVQKHLPYGHLSSFLEPAEIPGRFSPAGTQSANNAWSQSPEGRPTVCTAMALYNVDADDHYHDGGVDSDNDYWGDHHFVVVIAAAAASAAAVVASVS